MDLSVLFDVSYGMYIIGVKEGEKLGGCIINTVSQITSENPIVAVSMNKDNYTCEMIEKAKRFSVSILSEETSPQIIGTFGFSSSRDVDKYENCQYDMVYGIPIIKEKCCGALLFDLISVTDMDTHVVMFGQLKETIKLDNLTPMTYSYYHSVIKGKAPKNAPTYQQEDKKQNEVTETYVCKICGYVYEGELNLEPDDYQCPICKKPKDFFEKQ